MGRERVAGASEGSRAWTAMWPIITQSTPASTALRKGRSSTASSRARSAATDATWRWESTAVSPWPGKCLAVVRRPPDFAPLHERADELGHELGVLAERADVDHGVRGVVVDVGHGGERPVDPEGAALAGRDFAREARRVRGARGPEGHRVGQRHDPAPDAEGDPALHVRGDEQGHVGRSLQVVQEAGQRADLRVEDDERAHLERPDLVQQPLRGRRCGVPRQAGHAHADHLAHLLGEGEPREGGPRPGIGRRGGRGGGSRLRLAGRMPTGDGDEEDEDRPPGTPQCAPTLPPAARGPAAVTAGVNTASRSLRRSVDASDSWEKRTTPLAPEIRASWIFSTIPGRSSR